MASANDNFQITVVGVAALFVVGALLWFGIGGSDPVPTSVPSTAAADHETVSVHVSGAVIRPGLVRVPASSRVADVVAAAGGASPDANLGATNLAAPVRDGEHIVVTSWNDPPSAVGGESAGVDLNAATAGQLEALPGVGPVLAGRIVAFRDERGPFDRVEDLLDVPGIGEAKLSQMRDGISNP